MSRLVRCALIQTSFQANSSLTVHPCLFLSLLVYPCIVGNPGNKLFYHGCICWFFSCTRRKLFIGFSFPVEGLKSTRDIDASDNTANFIIKRGRTGSKDTIHNWQGMFIQVIKCLFVPRLHLF